MIAKRDNSRALRLVVATAVLTALFMVARGSAAQDLTRPAPHQGYYLALGGYGQAVFAHEGDGGWRDPWFGGTGDLRLGQAIFDWFDLGIGLGAGAVYEDAYRAVLGHVSLETQLRPSDLLFIRLGIGMGFADVTRTQKGIEKVVGRFGADFTVAVGYDFFPGHKGQSGGFAITPVVGFTAGPGDILGTYGVFVGIEISFWTGLPKDQLDLPMDEAYR